MNLASGKKSSFLFQEKEILDQEWTSAQKGTGGREWRGCDPIPSESQISGEILTAVGLFVSYSSDLGRGMFGAFYQGHSRYYVEPS